MHDPQTVAWEIRNPFVKKKHGYRPSLITIWHVDPQRDGSDDSCGWFIRPRHLPKGLVESVVKEFESEWDRTHKGEDGFVYNCGWFNPEGENVISVRGIVLNMYIYAAKIVLNKNGKERPGRMWKKAWKFINANYAEIMYFAENNRDSIRDTLVRKFQIGCNVEYTAEKRKEMIWECAYIVSSDIARRSRKWYQHPRWHIHHWKIQFHPWKKLKRRYWDKCYVCGKRGFSGAAYSDWNGNRIWHPECSDATTKPITL